MKDLAKWELIKNLDLSKVKEKLKSKKGIWWKWKNDVNNIEMQYKQFLYTAAINPGEVVTPFSEAMDDLWHEHILDTAKYEKDCMVIFGKVFHHNPHLSVGSKDQIKAYKKTKEMYKEAFEDKVKSKSSSDPGCGGSFVPIFCGGDTGHSHSHADVSGHDSHGHDGGSHGDSGGHSCGGSSDGGSSASCGGASSCGGGGSSCGGGGGCGGGGD